MTTTMNLHLNQEVKNLLAEAAKLDRRSISALVEILVMENCPKIIEARRGLALKMQQQASA